MKTINISIIVCLVVCVIFAWSVTFNTEAVLEETFKIGVWWVSGFRPEIGDFKLDLKESRIDVKDLNIRNLRGFPKEDEWMIQVPEIHMVYDSKSFWRGKIHIDNLEIYIKEVTVVRNKKGKINEEALKIIKQARKDVREKKHIKEKGSKAKMDKKKSSRFRIDKLHIRHKWVVYKDYTQDKWPFVKEYHAVFNERFRNVTDLEALRRDIIRRSLISGAVTSLAKYQTGLLGPPGVLNIFSPHSKEGQQTIEDLAKLILGLK